MIAISAHAWQSLPYRQVLGSLVLLVTSVITEATSHLPSQRAGSLETCSVDQSSFEFTEILLLRPPKCRHSNTLGLYLPPFNLISFNINVFIWGIRSFPMSLGFLVPNMESRRP